MVAALCASDHGDEDDRDDDVDIGTCCTSFPPPPFSCYGAREVRGSNSSSATAHVVIGGSNRRGALYSFMFFACSLPLLPIHIIAFCYFTLL